MLKALQNTWLYIIGFAFLVINLLLTYNDFHYLNLLPVLLIVVFAGIFHLDKLFLFIVLCTPLSLNMEDMDMGGIGFYLPTEPLLFVLMLIFLFKQVHGSMGKDSRIIFHPLSMALLFQLGWVFVTGLNSAEPVVSMKFLLSRMWFIIPLFFFGIIYFRQGIKQMYSFVWIYLIPLSLVLLITLIKHASYGFSEETGHWVMSPFFKDHTSYGAIIALFYPIVVSMFFDKDRSQISRALLGLLLLLFTVALFYSYTRAAWVSVVGAGLVYLTFLLKIKFKWLATVGIVVGGFVIINYTELSYMMAKNDAEHTTEDFGERLESMSNVSTDASNLERFNRWNCAVEMFKERPLMGWGAGSYPFHYAPFQDPADLTIISTNFGDGGNAHSEYLGPLAEQGILGLFWMVLVVIILFYTAATVYIDLEDKKLKRLVMMLMLALVTYFTHGVLNNYLDTDKASVPVWGFAAIIVAIDIYYRKRPNEDNSETELILDNQEV